MLKRVSICFFLAVLATVIGGADIQAQPPPYSISATFFHKEGSSTINNASVTFQVKHSGTGFTETIGTTTNGSGVVSNLSYTPSGAGMGYTGTIEVKPLGFTSGGTAYTWFRNYLAFSDMSGAVSFGSIRCHPDYVYDCGLAYAYDSANNTIPSGTTVQFKVYWLNDDTNTSNYDETESHYLTASATWNGSCWVCSFNVPWDGDVDFRLWSIAGATTAHATSARTGTNYIDQSSVNYPPWQSMSYLGSNWASSSNGVWTNKEPPM